MSAIFGIHSANGRHVDRCDMERMMKALAHRGPDGASFWTEGSTGLGHLMLHVTPESIHESLPASDASEYLRITADARLDNRDELIDQLKVAIRPKSNITDSQLILAAYEKWGERCVDWLLGDYAFVLWDKRRKALFCSRDPLGAKHFYYYNSPKHGFAFASEIKALLSLPWVPRRLNELNVAYHLLPLYDDKSITFYQDIFRLPSTECLRVNGTGITFVPNWKPDLSNELRLNSNEEYAEAFREVFIEAVRCRLRSAFPVGSMLSGGLDSSSITCVAGELMRRQNNGALHTFSAIWPSIAPLSPKIDESRFMRAVIAKGGFDPHFIYADSISPLVDWQKIFWHEDNMLSAPNMYMDWAIFKSAHEQGARVLLGGTDGDTVISYGYEDLAAFARRGRWLKLFQESRSLSKNMPKKNHNVRQIVWRMGFKPMVPQRIKQGWRMLRGSSAVSEGDSLPRYSRRRPINTAFVKRIGLAEQLKELHKDIDQGIRTPRENHWHDISSGDWDYILGSFEKAAAAHSLEIRYPFFDRRLVQFCLSLPPGQRLQDGFTRSILRRAMNGILPAEVQWRTDKGNLSAGVCLKLLEYERETLEHFVSQNSGIIEEYVDVAGLRSLYQKYISNPLGSQDEAFSLMLVTNLALWLTHSGFASSTTSLRTKSASH